MKMITKLKNFNKAKSRDLITLECPFCHGEFSREKHYVNQYIRKDINRCCSHSCAQSFLKRDRRIEKLCNNCNKTVSRTLSQYKKSKNGNIFCDSVCAATFNNTHKIKGCRRSKLETYLENKLKELYPKLVILFNDKLTIKSELDIYIPKLSLAIELNGIFHYEPIYGREKLNQIQNNDNRKFQACLEKEIELCIIDTSKLIYFKESNAKPFLDIISKIINNKLASLPELESGYKD